MVKSMSKPKKASDSGRTPMDSALRFLARARTVREPRKVLAEFGLELPAEVEVRVHDSNADMRYLVLPMPPPGAAEMPVEELIPLVTRHMLVGTAVVAA